MRSSLERVICALAPEVDDGDPERARQSRLVVVLTLIATTCAFSYGVIYLALGVSIAAVGTLSAGAVLVPMLLRFRRSGNVAAGGHMLAAAAVWAIALVSLGTGGVHSPALCWYLLAPMMVALAAGRRLALIWVGVITVCLMVTMVLDSRGFMPASQTPAYFVGALAMLCPMGLAFALMAIVWSNEGSREEALGQVRAASDAAREARDRAEFAHLEARQVLDNVAQGLVIARADGSVTGARSAALDTWFGPPSDADHVWDLFQRAAPAFAAWLEMSWGELESDWMPLELALDQLPKELALNGRFYSFAYHAVIEGAAEVMVVVTDDTHKVEARRAEEAQREVLAVFARVLKDPRSVHDFADESRRILAAIEGGSGSIAEERRWIHTLKGNCATFGLGRFARAMHELETELADTDAKCTRVQRAAIRSGWKTVEELLAPVLGEHVRADIVVDRATFDAALRALESNAARHDLAREIRSWQWRPVRDRLEQLADHSRALAKRIDKANVRFEIAGDDWRHPEAEAWTSFWSAAVHLVRNALDHGIESPEERIASGKSPEGRVTFRAKRMDRRWVLEVEDDGRGIDWVRVRAAAMQKGIHCADRNALVEALFLDGVTTREEATEVSGRGVGMAAVRQATEALSGRVEVNTTPGRGTVFRFEFPKVAPTPSQYPRVA